MQILNLIFRLLYVLLTSSVSVYFSATVNRSVVWLAVKGEVSQAPTDILLPSGEITSGFLFELAGYQSRRTLIHIPDLSFSSPELYTPHLSLIIIVLNPVCFYMKVEALSSWLVGLVCKTKVASLDMKSFPMY